MAKRERANPVPMTSAKEQPKPDKDRLRDLDVPEGKAVDVKGGPIHSTRAARELPRRG